MCGNVHYANLIEASELDMVPKPIFCRNLKPIPKNAITGRYLNPHNLNESQTRADHAQQAKQKEVLLLGYARDKFLAMGIDAKPNKTFLPYSFVNIRLLWKKTHE